MATNWENSYLDLVQNIIENGNDRDDRTGVGTASLFGAIIHIDLEKGFPAITTKTLQFKAVLSELLWFLSGSTDERRLAEIHYGVDRDYLIGKRTIWTDNADAQGVALGFTNTDYIKDLGKVYGAQWRNFGGVDQITSVIQSIKTNPMSRRHIVSAWNPPELSKAALPPCHNFFQFYVNDGKLSCMFNMRSTDVILGLPFNIASYALLTHMVAQVCGLKAYKLIYVGGDVHVYRNHIEGAFEQLSRYPKAPPVLKINPAIENIFDFNMIDFSLENYEHHPAIKFPMAV